MKNSGKRNKKSTKQDVEPNGWIRAGRSTSEKYRCQSCNAYFEVWSDEAHYCPECGNSWLELATKEDFRNKVIERINKIALEESASAERAGESKPSADTGFKEISVASSSVKTRDQLLCDLARYLLQNPEVSTGS